ncbi:hypothetical protein IVB27_32245 [Bradyrhizobium sp. 197]|uniref:hypothetical protein n=1 Tax=Bradyrhizobium sp. 197 TaxID=2782663 RepID=UPI001FFB7A03|nr:hypothetical protein [Bradyrhizobium sp. 197]MCK1479285.1 hypothetical protein [Bradyrhizobium sp. 197]
MSDHRTIEWAVDIIGMCEPIRCHQGGMWFGSNHNFADATFVDYGAADAFAVAAKALPGLVDALQRIASLQVTGGAAANLAERVLSRVGTVQVSGGGDD